MRAIAMYHHTPIDSLPVELLAHIFSLGTHHVRDSDDSDDSPPFTAESVKAPLIYGSVCRHWRAVTLRTAALYTSVCITPLLLRPSADGDVLDTIPISMYVARSRACPLDILIDARDPEWDAFADDGSYYIPPFSAGHMQTALRTLLPHLVRWRSLVVLTDLYIPMAAALRPLGAALATHGAPQLMDLRLLRCDAHAQAPDTDDVLFAGLAVDALGAPTPRLRNLQLVGVPAVWDTLPALLRPAFPSAPASLETLELSYLPHGTQPTLSQLARLLHAAPAMQRVVLRGSCLPSFSAFSLSPALAFSDAPAVFRLTSIVADDTADLEPPALPLLRALSLSCSSPPAALALLKLFGATPRLAEITLDDAEGAILPFGIDPSGTSGDAPLIATQAQAGGGAAAVLAGVLPGRPGAAALFPALARLTLRGALYPPTMAARDAEFIIGGVRVCVVRPAYADEDADADADSMYADDSFSDSDEGSVSEAEWEAGSEMGVEAEMGVKEDEAEDGPTNSEDAEAHNAYACAWSTGPKRSAASWVFAEAAAFRRGGVFNDPLFDARWAGVTVV